MNFSKRQADPRRHIIGFTLVILFHALVVYALVTGLAKKVVEVIRAPIETKVIEEIKKPPPPPEIVVPPPPKMDAPPPPFIPPPEVQLATPPPPQPTITATTPTPPPAQVTIAPVAPVPTAPAPAPATKPATVAIGTVCPTQVQPILPRKAQTESISGSVTARATVKGGKVVGIEIVSSQPRGVFDAAVRAAMSQYTCLSGDETVVVVQEFSFKVAD